MLVLLADEDGSTRRALAARLRSEGFHVWESGDGEEALSRVSSPWVDLVVLEWMLPSRTGYEVLRTMRLQGCHTPAIIWSARQELADRLTAFGAGADDFMPKDASLDEVSSRVRALVRRTTGRWSSELCYQGLTLDPRRRTATCQGKQLTLTPREFSLLQFFLEHPGAFLSKTQIQDTLWEDAAEVSSNVVEVYVSYLRAKLEKLGPPVLHTERGVGYRLGCFDGEDAEGT